MLNKLVLVIFSLLLNSQFCYAKGLENWELVKHDEMSGIDIYLRILPGGNIEFKGITSINTSLNSIVALFDDTGSMNKWLYRTEKAIVLRELNNKEEYIYSIHNMPFPLLKRDSVVHTRIMQDPNSLLVTIRGKAIPDYLPEKRGFVRVHEVESFWTFEPQRDGNVRIIFQGYGDPGGNFLSSIYRSPIFKGLFKIFLWKFPYRTFKRMKSIIYENKYQTKTFSYIVEPDMTGGTGINN